MSRGEKQKHTISRAERGTAYSLCRHFGRRFGEFALPQANKSPTVMKMSPIRAGTANTVLYQLDKIICFLENNFDVLFFETLLKQQYLVLLVIFLKLSKYKLISTIKTRI